jgi:hypothetical protein
MVTHERCPKASKNGQVAPFGATNENGIVGRHADTLRGRARGCELRKSMRNRRCAPLVLLRAADPVEFRLVADRAILRDAACTGRQRTPASTRLPINSTTRVTD